MMDPDLESGFLRMAAFFGGVFLAACLAKAEQMERTSVNKKALASMLPKEQEPRKPQRWVMPDDKSEEMFVWLTSWLKDDDRAARCRFWRRVYEIAPEAKAVKCRIDIEQATHVVICEVAANDDSDGDLEDE